MRLSISRGLIPLTVFLLSFPLYATFVSVYLVLVSLSLNKSIPADAKPPSTINRDCVHVPPTFVPRYLLSLERLSHPTLAFTVMRVYRKRRKRRRRGSLVTRTKNGLALGTSGSSDDGGTQTCRQMPLSDPNLRNLPCSTVPKIASLPTGSGPRSYSTSSSITSTLGEGIRT